MYNLIYFTRIMYIIKFCIINIIVCGSGLSKYRLTLHILTSDNHKATAVFDLRSKLNKNNDFNVNLKCL